MRIFFAALLALVLSAPAAAAELRGNPSTWWTLVVKTAKPGDVVVLESGTYADPKFYLVRKPGAGIAVRPARGAEVIFESLTFSSSEGMVFEDFQVRGPVGILNSANVEVSRLKVGNPSNPPAIGVTVRNSRNVEVRDSEISSVGIGVSIYANPEGPVRVVRNRIHDISGPDAIDSFSSSNVTIAGNVISDIKPAAGAHPDAIQVDSPVPGGRRSTGVLIEGNRYTRGSGEAAQGIFIGHADDVTVRENELFGTMFNGIALSDVGGGVVERNFVQSLPDYPTMIITRGGSRDITVNDNVAGKISTYTPAGDKPLVNYRAERNRALKGAKSGTDTAARDAWRVAKTAPVEETPKKKKR